MTLNARFFGLVDRLTGIDPSHADHFLVLRARAIVMMAPVAAAFAFTMGIMQIHGELSGAGTAYRGMTGYLSVITPLAMGLCLLAVPIVLRKTQSTSLCGFVILLIIGVGLAPWPLLLFGIYSRNILILTSVPILFRFLISERSAAVALVVVCAFFAALPVLADYGLIHQPDGVTLFDSIGHAAAAIITTIALHTAFHALIGLYERALREASAARQRALDLAESDQLTGLANRRVFTRHLEQRILEGAGDETLFALLLIDLDHFKSINDSYGHSTGDHLLNTVARRLTRLSTEIPHSIPARLGGDEFALVTGPLTDETAGEAFGERVVSAMRAPIQADHAVLYPTVSVGLAFWPQDGATAKDIMRLADMALYASKGAGRDRWHRADHEMKVAMEERQSLVSAMRGPDFTDQLEIWFQPQADMKTGKPRGLEALIRWRHPELGLLMPDSFICLAEENELIGRLTEHVIKHAIDHAAPWLQAGMIDRLAINVSGDDLQDTNLIGILSEQLRRWDLPPSVIELEVTESILLWNQEATFHVVQQLGHLGVRVALDDFGTGYSSLAYLRTLPINTIKIDKSFVFDCDTNPNSLAIIQAIIGLARMLDMETVAEGVETLGQRDILARLGASRMQGYLLSHPLPVDACINFLAEYRAEPVPLSESA